MTDDEKSDITSYKPGFSKPDIITFNKPGSLTLDPSSMSQPSTASTDATDVAMADPSSTTADQLSPDATNDAKTDLTDAELTILMARVSGWCTTNGINLNKLKVVMSEFTNDKLTLATIQKKSNALDLLKLLREAGLINPTDISVLIEIIKLSGIEGVQSEIKEEWKVPKFKDVQIKHVREHRKKLLAFGRKVSKENVKTIGFLNSILVDENTDPYFLILELERNGLLKAGEMFEKFIKTLKEFNMHNEVDALEHGE
ncbi:uncharacterized protein [Antedon mediterranea]|uniref:uncharacterized protein isoform X2 n=1 Tax=Antedon mediterranea TaxID=105859 RepID=UPI003AF986D0